MIFFTNLLRSLLLRKVSHNLLLLPGDFSSFLRKFTKTCFWSSDTQGIATFVYFLGCIQLTWPAQPHLSSTTVFPHWQLQVIEHSTVLRTESLRLRPKMLHSIAVWVWTSGTQTILWYLFTFCLMPLLGWLSYPFDKTDIPLILSKIKGKKSITNDQQRQKTIRHHRSNTKEGY